MSLTIILSCWKADYLIESYIDALIQIKAHNYAQLLVVDFPFSHSNPQHVSHNIRRFGKFDIISRSDHLSLYQAWNLALTRCDTPYVCNLNLDDRVDREYYPTALKVLSEHKAAIFSSSAHATRTIGTIDNNSFLQQHLPDERFNDENLAYYTIGDLVEYKDGKLRKTNIPHCSPVWRRRLHSQYGYFRSRSYDFCADYEFWLRVASGGEKLVASKMPMTIFYCSNNTASDRLMHAESERIIARWQKHWPPPRYKQTHLGEKHDRLHFCLNMNAAFAHPHYLKNTEQSEVVPEETKQESVQLSSEEADFAGDAEITVSVIIPVFNASEFIERCLASIEDQEITGLEVIAVDDGSSDDSVAKLEAFKRTHPRLRLTILCNAGKKGVSGARNTGIKKAAGRYVAFLDADDTWYPESLRKRLACIESCTDTYLVHGPTHLVTVDGMPLGTTVGLAKEVGFEDCSVNPLHLNSLLLPASVASRFSFDEDLANGEDWLFVASILRSGLRSIYCAEAECTYTVHASSTVVSDPVRHEKALSQVINWLTTPMSGSLIAKEFSSGLGEEKKKSIVAQRNTSLLLYAILRCDLPEVGRLFLGEDFSAYVRKLSLPALKASLKVPLLRRFLVPANQVATACPAELKNAYVFLIEYLALSSRAPMLTQALHEMLGLQDTTSAEGHQDRYPDLALHPSDRPVIIIGNGPSAALLPFARIANGGPATVGMNAAYRFWDMIGFRPTYYICMDTVVIKSHQDAIYELIQEGKISGFFLRDEIKEKYPDLAKHPKIFWYSQAKDASRLFSTTSVTTGSWAIRWMAHLGYKRIGLIGIDAQYVELLPEAQPVDSESGLELRIKNTPAWNPNYFFDSYQRAGDKYNVPNNPDVLRATGQHVHIQSLARAYTDARLADNELEVWDCSPSSDHQIFPKTSIDRFVADSEFCLITSCKPPSDHDDARSLGLTLAANSRNKRISKVHLLLEGDWAGLLDMLPESLADELRALCNDGSIEIVDLDHRPTYAELFAYAGAHARGTCAIANADIYLPERTCDLAASALTISDSDGNRRLVYALTRWNLTKNGLFLQGMTSNPPWQEIAVNGINSYEFNCFSYDVYIFRPFLAPPVGTNEILLGTYGCDTALAAVLKLAGFEVSNPSVSMCCVHIDDKVRAYDSQAGREGLIANVNAVRKQLEALCTNRPELLPILSDMSQTLRRNCSWIAGKTTLDAYHSIFRALGSTPCSTNRQKPSYSFHKIRLTDEGIDVSPEQLSSLLYHSSSHVAFLEWECASLKASAHPCDRLSSMPGFENMAKRVSHYQWQTFISTYQATPDERKAMQLAQLLIRHVLLGSMPSNTQSDRYHLFPHTNNSRDVDISFHSTAGFTQTGANLWKLSLREELCNDYLHYIFATSVRKGTRVAAVFNLAASSDVKLKVSLARHGSTKFESSHVEITASRVPIRHIITHTFSSNHEALRLQLEVLSCNQEPIEVELTTDLVSVNGLRPLARRESHSQTRDTVSTARTSKQTNFATAILGPYSREQSAHFDETDAVAAFLDRKVKTGAMIDVGAHQGYALAHFLERGWKIWAFEPDATNRSKLEARLRAHPNSANVTLDTRCVSNESKSDLPFYQSDESTGISGLSAFRDTHREAQRVDSVSLKDFFNGQEMPEVDFLKIDTEGHDLFVLQGFPWERNRPKVIECEFEDLKSKPLGYTTADMADFLVGQGYTVYVSEWHPILRYGQRHDWHRLQKYPCKLASEAAWGNLLAFSTAPDERQLVDAVKSVLQLHDAAPAGPAAPPRDPVSLSANFEHTKQFAKLAANEWLLTHDPQAKQQLIIANYRDIKTRGKKYVGVVVVESDSALRIQVSLGRIGQAPYEGTAKSATLEPGMAAVLVVPFSFQAEHPGAKIQIDVKDCPAKQARLLIDECALVASAKDLAEDMPVGEGCVDEANKLFRQKKYAQSIPLYLAAADRMNFGSIKLSGRLCLRRMGVKDNITAGKMLEDFL
jgi:FkbM family methyltransferase